MTDLVALKAANAKRWANAKLTRGPEFAAPAKKALANKATYIDIATRSGMPADAWIFVAVTHYRESSQDFSKSLAQGDPWAQTSKHVPAGRGPFKSFADAAVDALVNCSPYAARNADWSLAGLLTLLERYNGLGYANRGIPSPYIWSGTDQYTKGKYVADEVFDPNEVDKQLGCAGLILAIQAADTGLKVIVASQPAIPPSAAVEKDGAWLQAALNKLGASPQLDPDGIVGPATRNAVRAFQLAQGLEADGLVGPATFTALDKALAAGKPIATMPVPPEIVLPPPGTKASADLAPTFWGRVANLFKPKGVQ